MRSLLKTLILIFSLCLCFSFLSSCKKTNQRSLYELKFKYNDDKIDGKLSYKFVNSYNTSFDHLVFNLHANAYKQDATHKPTTSTTEARAYPNGMSYGDITINNVTSNSTPLQYEIYGDDCQFLKVYVDEIKNRDYYNIEIDFTTTLPNSTLRLGKTSVGVNLADFFPTACKIENGKFRELNYSPIGDPYLADIHDYKVDATIPSEYSIASSGFPTLTTVDGSYTTYSYELFSGRDFALALSKNYKVFCKTQGDVVYTYYGFGGDGEDCLNQMIECCEYYSKIFGKYQYKSLSLAECDFVFGGMEYSGLCFINHSLPNEEKTQVIAHEVAHEWWHSTVGNDQNESAYLDEGLAEYSAYLYELRNVNKQRANEYVNSAKLAYKSFFTIEETLSGKTNTVMNRELCTFKNEYEYANIAYNKSLIMFYEYGKAIGEDTAIKNLANVFNEHKNKDLNLQSLIQHLGYSDHFNSFVNGKVLI